MEKITLATLFLAVAERGHSLRHSGFRPGAASFVHPSRTRRPFRHVVVGRRRVIARLSFSNDEDNSEKDNGFPAWVKALTRWDASKEGPPPSNARDRNEGISFDTFPFAVGNNKRSRMWKEEMSPLVADLSGMANVEALVTVAAVNETDEEMDLLLPSIGDLTRSILDIDTETNGRVNGEEAPNPSTKIFQFLDNALRWEEFIPLLQKNVQELTDLIPDDKGLNVTFDELVNMIPEDALLSEALTETDKADSFPSTNAALATEKILQDASQRLELLINGTSYAFSPSAFQSLILRASNALAIQEASGNLTAAAYSILEQAGKAPRATAEYTAELVEFANGVLVGGYGPLFGNYPSVKNIPSEERQQKIVKAAEFASLSGAIYEDTVPTTHGLGHSIIAQGESADIGWMVTDSVQYEQDFWADSERKEPILVRTFVIRGYDASDEEVDRERLLNVICTASPVSIYKSGQAWVQVHEGMLSMARELLRELNRYIDLTSPSHKFVFTGHSIGGSLAILLMILLANDRDASFVRDNVLRVFTFGSPPIFQIDSTSYPKENGLVVDTCSILEAFDLPTDIVYSYCQPWDPIVRLFSKYDPLYPLIDDLGEDGYTPWVSGPSRTLRPILKTILESWEGWPGYRDNARAKLGQNYIGVGEQYLLLPEPIRYLTDRLVAVNTAVPATEAVVRVSPHELLPALNEVFLLDTFTISYVSVAIRSFVHHFYPAYGSPFVDYAKQFADEEEKEMQY